MRITALTVLMTLQTPLLAQTLEQPAPPPVNQAARDAAIKEAVREMVEQEKKSGRELGEAYRTDSSERFEQKFEDARVPGCLRPDGLKRQPTFVLGGLLALPFIAVAKVRGKCQ